MKIADCRLGFIGFGHMAKVIAKAIEQSRLIPLSQISFVQRDKDRARQNETDFGIAATNLQSLVHNSDLILLAVRPSQAATVLQEMTHLQMSGSKMIVSVLAGIQLAYYKKFFKNPILRVMPNIASQVGEGMSVFSYDTQSSIEFKSLTNILFSCMGQVVEVPESMMDLACGMAGSSPGFVFRLIEAMARFGEKEGLAYPKALKIAAQAFYGASKLILKGAEPDKLISQIATPHGTTEAGFRKMTALELDSHFQSVVEASMKRSAELSKEFS
jgi:pyrroline-5-carboxylate reductase